MYFELYWTVILHEKDEEKTNMFQNHSAHVKSRAPALQRDVGYRKGYAVFA